MNKNTNKPQKLNKQLMPPPAWKHKHHHTTSQAPYHNYPPTSIKMV